MSEHDRDEKPAVADLSKAEQAFEMFLDVFFIIVYIALIYGSWKIFLLISAPLEGVGVM